MDDSTYVKLFRKFKQWEWYKDGNTVRLFIHLMLDVNFKPSRYMGHDIPAGSVVTGYAALASQLGMSVKNVRTAMDHLKSTGEITTKAASKFSIVSLTNWRSYQSLESSSGKQVAGRRQASGKQVAASKEGNKERRKEIRVMALAVIDSLNLTTGKSFKCGEANLRPIIARANEGHTIADFEKVIASKHAEWSSDESMRAYMRPETLFGPKFDGYLQAATMQPTGRSRESRYV